MMNLEEEMKNHGFNFSASCAGKGSYTKWIKHRGKRAYIAVHDASEAVRNGREVHPPCGTCGGSGRSPET